MTRLSFLLVVGALVVACRDSVEPAQRAPGAPQFSFVTDVTVTDLGTLGGGYSYAVAVNNRGQVAGNSATASGDQHPFLWQKGTMTDLGTLGGSFGQVANAINDLGQVVGYGWTIGDASYHALLWQNGTMTDLGALTGCCSNAVAVNGLGQVVGNGSTTGSLDPHAFLWQSGTMTDLGTLGGCCSYAYALNDLGQVVGYSFTTGDVSYHAFLWQNGTMTDLGTLGGDYNSDALAVNALGQVVGSSLTTGNVEQHATLWDTLRPATPAEEVSILTNDVNNLNTSGVLNQGQAQALLARLEVISRQLNSGNNTAAITLLQSFINQVRAYVNAGLLSAADGQTLIDAAQHAIEQLSA